MHVCDILQHFNIVVQRDELGLGFSEFKGHRSFENSPFSLLLLGTDLRLAAGFFMLHLFVSI